LANYLKIFQTGNLERKVHPPSTLRRRDKPTSWDVCREAWLRAENCFELFSGALIYFRRTETTQLSRSNEPCEELRSERFVETPNLLRQKRSAKSKDYALLSWLVQGFKPHSQMLASSVR